MNIIETNLNFNSLSYGNKPNAIVLHHAEWSKCTVEDIHRLHKNSFGWSGIGYHYFVRKDGSIYRGRPDNAIGAHAKNHNTNTLGICAEGSYMRETMPEAQKRSIIQLGQYLKNKHGIGKVYGHKELMATDCPGTNYPLGEIKSAILSGAPTPAPSPNKPNIVWDDSVRGKIGTVTASELNVRYTADGEIIGTLKRGSKVRLWRLEGDWYHINSPFDGYNQAYVHKNYISIDNSSPQVTAPNKKYGIVTAKAGLNVRKGAGTNYPVVGVLKYRERVQLDVKVGKWWSTYYGAHGGFVSADYIREE